MFQTETDNKVKLEEKFRPSCLIVKENFGSREIL